MSHMVYSLFCFLSGYFVPTETIYETAGARRGHLSSYLQIPPTHHSSDIYLQMCISDETGIILITAHVTEVIYTTDEIYPTLGFSVLLNVNCILTY